MKTLLALCACTIASAGVPLQAAAQSVQPGLWEVRSKMLGNPQMNQAMAEMQKQLAAMPPEQRKQMEAVMAQQGIQLGSATPGGGVSMRMCLTPEMAQRNDFPATYGDCKTTSQSRNGNTFKASFSCTNPPSQGEQQVTITSPQAYTMRMTATSTVNGKTEKTEMEGAGQWLAADCGKVKPVQMPSR